MGRMSQGWGLTKKSWQILKTNKHLTLFVVWGALVGLLAAAIFAVPGAILLNDKKQVPAFILFAVGGYLATFAGIYFNVGLAASANAVMTGKQSSFKQGMSVASERMGPIAGWALFTVTINLILQVIRSEAGWLGQIVTGLFSLAWNLVTFLVVPVIALEGLGPIDALKRSASLFKKRWGQQVTGNIAIGGIIVLAVILPAIVIGVIGGFIAFSKGASGAAIGLGGILIAVAVVMLIIGMVISGALRGIFGVALFHFADTGEGTHVFSAEELQGSIQQKKKKGLLGR